MNIKEIKEMISLMNESGLVELEIEKEGMRIRLKKTSTGTEVFTGPVVVERERAPDEPAKETPQVPEKLSAKTVEIKAPMVGTFYRAPAPEAPPYAEVGQVIENGQVICIIEAMKLMNEIKSEIRGKILEILVDNAEPVEFGQSMFLIEPL
ncbi:MAG TPA: acetyl-CoA carboxylase biotin carboxyl carrier protein [Candidatus Margulisiibacteriota bacterium]|nr:acetyl-CoA carboxylase biotin carboxyl carrier protein [Candidatus Margulisiibacteriota bacterium]